jgi:hypothetical protein
LFEAGIKATLKILGIVVLVNFCNLSVGHDLAFGAGMGFQGKGGS